jgi:CrcB protein
VRSPHPLHVSVIAAVAVGGVAGSLLRYALTVAFPDPSTSFPWTIFVINVVGSFVLAALPAIASVVDHPLLPPLLGTGVLGGFTTMSTFANQARSLADNGHQVLSGVYVLGTLVAALVAVTLAEHLTSSQRRRLFQDEEGDL